MHKKYSKKTKIIIASLILIILVICVFLYSNYIHKNNTKSVTVNTKSASVNNNSVAKTGSATSSPEGTQSNTQSQQTTGTNLTPPSGEFISNYSPGINNSSLAERSVCNVQPGVSCTIYFTNGDITKNLAPQTAGQNGAVLWNWTPSDIQLTSGTWHVKAVASLNGVSATTTDTYLLNIQ